MSLNFNFVVELKRVFLAAFWFRGVQITSANHEIFMPRTFPAIKYEKNILCYSVFCPKCHWNVSSRSCRNVFFLKVVKKNSTRCTRIFLKKYCILVVFLWALRIPVSSCFCLGQNNKLLKSRCRWNRSPHLLPYDNRSE